jgi:CRP-like cAMP-binding protein
LQTVHAPVIGSGHDGDMTRDQIGHHIRHHSEKVWGDALAELPMFYACTRREIAALSRLATRVDVSEGKVLTTEGDPGQEFFIVLAGTAVATHESTEVAVFGPGDCFGEIAMLDPGPRTATVVASTPMTLAVVGRREFEDILDAVPTLAHKLMRSLAKRVRAGEPAEIG